LKKYKDFISLFPNNVVLGVTMESNREYPISKAPSPFDRYRSMADIDFENKLVCVEPIMDLDLEILVQ
jgi:hypothetical protein